MNVDEHWERLWTGKRPNEVGWFEAKPTTTLELIGDITLKHDSEIVDVGGGASTLVDELLDRGFERLTVVDLAESSLNIARARLGPRADRVRWLQADARALHLSSPADLWHDRAVFHFLIEPADQEGYLSSLREAVGPGGHVIIATFGPQGPQECSGLRVERYDAGKLSQRLGSEFRLLRSLESLHITPWGSTQQFTYCLFRRTE
ncbi:MAG: class I SAM-dependent methyltransferase [Acidobacteriia bacterium]|nr:class I SAM-dependent methyltransferase [Terriglobia bacterium]